MKTYYGVSDSSDFFMHYGVRGMKWGIRKKFYELRQRSGKHSAAYDFANRKLNDIIRSQTSAPTITKTAYSGATIKKTNSSSQSNNHAIASNAKKAYYGPHGGTIDLNSRKVVHNKDGSISTERSFSVNIDGKETLLPTVINGKIVDEDTAIDHYYRTGEHLGQFDTVEEADEYAEALHNRQAKYYEDHNNEKQKNQKSKLKGK